MTSLQDGAHNYQDIDGNAYSVAGSVSDFPVPVPIPTHMSDNNVYDLVEEREIDNVHPIPSTSANQSDQINSEENMHRDNVLR